MRCGGWERSVSEFVSSPSGEVQWRVTRRNNTGISEYWPSWMDHGTPNKAGGVVFRTCFLLSSPPDRLLVTPNFPIRTNYTVLLCYRPRPHASSSIFPCFYIFVPIGTGRTRSIYPSVEGGWMWWYRDGPQKRPILEIDTPQKEGNIKKTVPHKNSCSVSPPTKGIIPPQQGEEGEQRNETVRVWKRTQHDPPAAPNQIIQRTTGHNKTSRHVRIKGQKKARKRTNHSSLR